MPGVIRMVEWYTMKARLLWFKKDHPLKRVLIFSFSGLSLLLGSCASKLAVSLGSGQSAAGSVTLNVFAAASLTEILHRCWEGLRSAASACVGGVELRWFARFGPADQQRRAGGRLCQRRRPPDAGSHRRRAYHFRVAAKLRSKSPGDNRPLGQPGQVANIQRSGKTRVEANPGC